jgi:hypothetical protein
MAMLRVYLIQDWFGYSDPAMEEALYETTILRQLAGLNSMGGWIYRVSLKMDRQQLPTQLGRPVAREPRAWVRANESSRSGGSRLRRRPQGYFHSSRISAAVVHLPHLEETTDTHKPN